MKFRDDIIPVGLNDESTLYKLFDTGDIVLNRGEYQVWNHPMYYYALYCSISRTIFTHAGIIVKDAGKLYILHVSPKFKGVRDFLGSHPQPHAFILQDLRQYIQRYKGTTLIRRRKRVLYRSDEESSELTNVAKKMYHEYQTGGYRFTRLGTLISRYISSSDDVQETPNEVHCAEFVGLLLQKMGLLDSGVKCWNVYPDSFSIEKNEKLNGYENVYFNIKQDLKFFTNLVNKVNAKLHNRHSQRGVPPKNV